MKIGGESEIYKTGIINSQSENAHSYLYLSNSNGADSALKTMIMSEAQSSWSRGKLHFCLNNDATTNSTSQNATIAHSRMSLDYSGNLTVSGTALYQNNLTISGTLQSPLTSLISTSCAVIDGKIGTGIIGANISAIGTTSGERTINCNSYVLINNGDGNNSYLRFGVNGGKQSLVGQINAGSNGDLFLRQASSGSKTYFQNSSSSNIMTLDNSGNIILSGSIDSTGGSTLRGTDPLVLYNSGGSVNLKLQSSAGTMRFETNLTPDLTLYNNSNQDVVVFGNNRVCYFKDDIEVVGDSTTSGICRASAHVPTSESRFKKNIKKIENTNLIDKLEFKSYDKILDEENDITFKDCGLIIEEIENDDFLKTFIHKHKDKKYLNYNGIFCNLFSELISEIKNLKEEINSLKK